MLKDRVWVKNKVQLKLLIEVKFFGWFKQMMHNGFKYIDINVYVNIFNVYSPEKQNGY